MTSFAIVYNRFLDKITDDMYVELSPEDTVAELQNLIIAAIPKFEFPRVNLYDYTIQTAFVPKEEVTNEDFVLNSEEEDTVEVEQSYFSEDLSLEEIDILAYNMLDGWLQRQVTSIEVTRMKYSGSDFKFTSQANHLQKLMSLQDKISQKTHHLQRLYKRREQNPENNNRYRSTWYMFGKSALDDQ